MEVINDAENKKDYCNHSECSHTFKCMRIRFFIFCLGAKGTGAGLAEWALNAYNSGWSYVYGGSTPGAVDCSGLIYSYA